MVLLFFLFFGFVEIEEEVRGGWGGENREVRRGGIEIERGRSIEIERR